MSATERGGRHPALLPARRDLDSAAFFDAAAAGRLLVMACERCATVLPGAARSCVSCHANDLRPQIASGSGCVVTWTIVAAGRPGPDAPPPVVAGLVELDEGPWIPARLTVEPGRLAVGLRVHASFAPAGDESVPIFGEPPSSAPSSSSATSESAS